MKAMLEMGTNNVIHRERKTKRKTINMREKKRTE
jgi:hypothetical protein